MWTWIRSRVWELLRPSELCSRVFLGLAVFCCLGGGWGVAEEQVERGQPNVLLDSAGNVLSVPQKVILLNPKIDNHHISSRTEGVVRDYLVANPDLKEVKVRLNQGALFGDIKSLVKNKKVEWYWRIFPGIPVTIYSSLTGRLLGGDHYNPFTNTVHLYSDDPAVALHELGHAKDFERNTSKGLYAVGRILPPVALSQEHAATDHAVDYLKQNKDEAGELKAYNTLYPAYGTYLGSYSGVPYGNVVGAGVGHVAGAWKRHEQKVGYEVMKNAKVVGEPVIELDSVGQSLVRNDRETQELLYGAFNNKNNVEIVTNRDKE